MGYNKIKSCRILQGEQYKIMKNIKHIIKETLNKDEFISLRTFENRLCDEQKREALSLYNDILNNSKLNLFLLKTNKYKNVNISSSYKYSLTWYNGIWIDGILKNVEWYNGTWINGEWKDGYWNNGIWYNGIWNGGTWHDGIWNYGEWIDGVWYSGHWLGGKWNKEKIWNNNLHEYFITTLNPAEYYKENNIKQ